MTTQDLSSSDVSFHALREYVPGDDRRAIHWRTTARTGRFMVRVFEETRRSHLFMLLSVSPDDYLSETTSRRRSPASDPWACSASARSGSSAWSPRLGSCASRARADFSMHCADVELTPGAEPLEHLVEVGLSKVPGASVVAVVTGSGAAPSRFAPPTSRSRWMLIRSRCGAGPSTRLPAASSVGSTSWICRRLTSCRGRWGRCDEHAAEDSSSSRGRVCAGSRGRRLHAGPAGRRGAGLRAGVLRGTGLRGCGGWRTHGTARARSPRGGGGRSSVDRGRRCCLPRLRGTSGLPTTTIGGVLPSLETLQRLVLLTYESWRDLLTVSVPASAFTGPAVVPYLSGLVCSARPWACPSVRASPVGSPARRAVLGGRHPVGHQACAGRSAEGVVFTATALGWSAWRTGRSRSADRGC